MMNMQKNDSLFDIHVYTMLLQRLFIVIHVIQATDNNGIMWNDV